MDLRPYLDDVRHELAVAAEAGGADARALAERLTAPLAAAMRLTLLDVLSASAGEITRDLAPGSVDVRLRGRDPEFVVTMPPPRPSYDDAGAEPSGPGPEDGPPSPGAASAALPPPGGGDEGGTSRINLRLPDDLKVRIEEAAARERLSVNAWLVRAVAAAVEPDGRSRRSRQSSWGPGERYTGWVR